MRLISYINIFTISPLLFLIAGALHAQQGQINIPRIQSMPNLPAPYNVRDWKLVARQYDSLVFDMNAAGQYLPLSYKKSSGLNYPENETFGLVTYVGTFNPMGNEGINVLPTLVGSTLVGINKSDQNGTDFVLMSQDFFNKRNGENIYLNNPGGKSGGDWWYDLMPNVFFYQLYDLYPDAGGEYEFQFNTVAERFAESVRGLGGNDAPWTAASMNYRGWDFVSQQPNASGVIEPEAAGAYGWVLYNAYLKTGNKEYLKAAEWSIEFLNSLNSNPSYELQLPYGTYVAARMNAELGTDYNVQKMVNWSFDRGALRGWGTIVGKWNGFDVSGLVGEANDNGNDYAFNLNGMQQAGALVPMVRYDKRFARAIGKWVLNLANASRLFYPGFLPANLQDGAAWSSVNDPNRVIAHEAMKEVWEGKSPFSTGDALRSGWASTNLALYGSSSVGYLGAIIDKTNDDRIFKLDLLATDFYKPEAYPSYLYFNPHSTAKTVDIEVGDSPVDIYDALTETFIAEGVSGPTTLQIPADQALSIVLVPTGGARSYEKNSFKVNGVIVDYRQSAQSFNYSPRIKALAAEKPVLAVNDSTKIYLTAFDQDSPDLNVEWQINSGSFNGEGSVIHWKSNDSVGLHEIKVMIEDEAGQKDSASIFIEVLAEINQAPVIRNIIMDKSYVHPGESIQIMLDVFDPNGDDLEFDWIADNGIITGSESEISWQSPAIQGIFNISVIIRDPEGLQTTATIPIWVRDFENIVKGDSIAYYAFSGNANDSWPNQLNGVVTGARLTADHLGNSTSAYIFNGNTHHIRIPHKPVLDFQDGITVSFYFQASQLPDRESFLISHGSWQNRWKISITPERKIRWTINTLSGITDLDASVILETDEVYHVVATYDGNWMALYVNGNLHSFKPMAGKLRISNLDLLFAQMIPGDQNYNFAGILDEIKIYDYAVNPDESKQLFESISTSFFDSKLTSQKLLLFPNPASDYVQIELPDIAGTCSVFDGRGQRIFQSMISDIYKGGQFKINTTSWSAGTYFIVMQTDEGIWSNKFIKLNN